MTPSFVSGPRCHPRRAVLGTLPPIARLDGSPIQILVVDDEQALTDLVQRTLQYEGWVVNVASNGEQALAKYRQAPPDAVVLDIMLPDIDGLQILREIQVLGRSAPTLFLTARDSVRDCIAGLTAGGDDYMTKPFSLEELVTRLRGLIRRAVNTAPGEDIISVGDVSLNRTTREVARGGIWIQLTYTEFELLNYLMSYAGLVLTRKQILDHVWKYDFAGRTNLVDLYVCYLRKKIDNNGAPMIRTVRGVGYMLREPE